MAFFANVSLNKSGMKGCFCTAPNYRSLPLNLLSEAVGTFILVFAIKGIAQVTGIAGGAFARQGRGKPKIAGFLARKSSCVRFSVAKTAKQE